MALHTLWCQAVDAAQSDDFRDAKGKLNEKAYLAYQRRAIAQCLAALAKARRRRVDHHRQTER